MKRIRASLGRIVQCAGTPVAVLIFCFAAGCGRLAPDNRTAEEFWWPEEPVSAAERRLEIQEKLNRVHDYLRGESLGGLLIGRSEDFAWISAGVDSSGEALLFIRDDGRKFLIAGDATAKLLLAEDLKDLGCEARVIPWYRYGRTSQAVLAAVAELSGGREFGSDIPFDGARLVEPGMVGLRVPLTASEITKYRWLGKTCAIVMSDVSRRLRPGMNERAIEALVSDALARHAIFAAEIHVATDGRLAVFPDAPPSDDAKLDRLVRIGIRARRWGMDIAMTRCVCFGGLPGEVHRGLNAVAQVCAGMWARSVPDAVAGRVLQGAIEDYAAAGFPGEWEASAQGGAIGYGGWDWVASPDSTERALDGQVLAWRPQVHGIRMEDTILLLGDNLEVLTEIEGWPVVEAKALGRIYRLPGILVR